MHKTQMRQLTPPKSASNEMQKTEIQQLETQVKQEKSRRKQEIIKNTLKRMKSKVKSRTDKDEDTDIRRQIMRNEKEAVMKGKQPFYLKEHDQRRLIREEKLKLTYQERY